MRTLLLATLSALVLASCGRTFPPTLARSAASLETEPARAALVGRALREDPPLPGEPLGGWEALEPVAAPQHGGHHHAH